MTDWRLVWRRLGGPSAVTWPAFWATLITSAIGLFATGGQIPVSIGVRLLAIVGGQLVMFIPLVLLRFTLVRSSDHPRPWASIAGFIVAPFLRTLALAWVLVHLGGLADPALVTRMVSAFPNIFLTLLLTAVVVGALREHRQQLAQLLVVREDLERTRQRVQTQVTERNEEAVQRVRSILDEELARLDAVKGADTVSALQHLATEVVRPLSHEMAQAVPSWHPNDDRRDPLRLDWPEVIRDVGNGGPFVPWLTALLMTFIAAAPANSFLSAARWPMLIGASLGIWLCLTVANAVLDRVLPLRSAPSSLTVVVLASALAASIPSAAAGITLGGEPGLALFIGACIFIAGLSLLIAVGYSVLAQQQRTQRELEESTEQLRRDLVRLHQLQWHQQKALSRALHGPVQSAVTAAALQLDAAYRDGSASAEFIAEVRTHLHDVIVRVDDVGDPALDLDSHVHRLLVTWARVCTITIDVAPAARSCLEADPVLRSTTMDIVTEAVSNAVRHGHASQVEVHVARVDHALRVVVDDDGTESRQGPSTGLGSRLLEECTMTWELTAEPTGRRLVADCPI